MNIAYFGSPNISAELLKSINYIENAHVAFTVTQPEKPAGKHLSPTATAVKEQAIEMNIPIFDKHLSAQSVKELIQEFRYLEIDLCIVFAYGSIIPLPLLNAVRYGFWNIHPSLLPKYRGAAPTTYPLALGELETGVSLIQLNEKMDQGDIIEQVTIHIRENMTRKDIEEKTIPLASSLIATSLHKLQTAKTLPVRAQKHTQATYTRRIVKQDGYIPFKMLINALSSENSPETSVVPAFIASYFRENAIKIKQTLPTNKMIWNMYRAFIGWPGIWTFLETPKGKKRLLIRDMYMQDNRLILKKVQIEGKKEVFFSEFSKAYNISI